MRRLTVVLVLGLFACGLNAVGQQADPLGGDDGGPPGPGGPDGSTLADAGGNGGDDAAVDAPPPCNSDACALPQPAGGFSLVLFGDGDATCPAGFDSANTVSTPVAGAGTCTCGACTFAGTSCANDNDMTTSYDNGNGMCGTTGATLNATNGNCNNDNGSFADNARVNGPAPTLGTCTSAATANDAMVTTTAHTICTPRPETCIAEICTPPAAMTACLIAAGDVACPVEAPTKTLVGSNVTVSCAAQCGCTVTSAVCGGTIRFYENNNCNGDFQTLTIGQCMDVNGGFSSYRYFPTVMNEQCATTPPQPAFTFVDQRTICCP